MEITRFISWDNTLEIIEIMKIIEKKHVETIYFCSPNYCHGKKKKFLRTQEDLIEKFQAATYFLLSDD